MQAGVTLVPQNHLGELLRLVHIYLDLLTSLLNKFLWGKSFLHM